MPHLTLWDEISQNLAHLEANSHKTLVSDCRYGVSPVNYPDPDLTEFSEDLTTHFMKK